MIEQMMYRPLTTGEIRAIEAKVDSFFDSQPVPGRNLAEARWKVLTAVEDSLRLVFAGRADAWLDPSAARERSTFLIMMDRYKYSLKHSLDLIRRANLSETCTDIERYGASGDDYLQVNYLLHGEAKQYADAVSIFTSIWSEDVVPYGKPERDTISMRYSERRVQYHAIELLTAKHVDDYSPVPLLAAVFAAPATRSAPEHERWEWGEAIKKIVASTKVKSQEITYQFVTARGKELYESLLHEPSALPKSWNFPWSNASTATRFSTALLALCFYHIISIYFGSGKYSLLGVGLNGVGLMLRRKEFVRRIVAISGITPAEAEATIAALTYGNKVKTPDPALQPFIPIAGEMLFVPCMMVVTNQWSRNMLSLHARVNSTTFDSQSGVFEVNMIDRLLVYSDVYRCISNKTFTASGWAEEVDLLYVDPTNKTLLVCELKWTIPPGDPREVMNRRTAVAKKVKQVLRKASGIEINLQRVLIQAGVNGDTQGWEVLPLVVIGGYSGEPSETPRFVPVVPEVIMTYLLGRKLSLRDIHGVLTSPLWMPRSGIDIDISPNSQLIGTVELQSTGYSVLRDAYFDEQLPKYVDDALRYSVSQRDALQW